ncbi:ubiquitin carboxyl-terminal hydrolase [Toxorhynchites rutilus septentrionalis]|uniref:ubiquitin carboxyl-terminal hydrolase n=1 Tax=Toxorhynchites rutilus septentrionalis TaxID=329112 RepID=UPI00247A3F7F|nr:ubiquitin carboxyl-terminal hydrolase [Toxorhynchites rutilus septentrionalis]
MSTWLPLESNPEVLNKYLVKLGVSPAWSIVDIYGMDDELLAFVPSPLKSLIFLFPCSNVYEEFRAKEDEELKAINIEHPENLFYMRQYVHNACGTIALVHAVLNNPDIELEEGSFIKKYYDSTKDLTPEERGKALENDVGFIETHESVANEGQTAAPDINEKVYHHFIAFVHFDGKLYELDGRKNFPVVHGETSPDTLLKDAIAVCKQYIARDPNEVRFTLLGLAATQ